LYVLGGDLVIPLLEGVMSHRSHLAAGFREYLIMREPLGRWAICSRRSTGEIPSIPGGPSSAG
jgi:hypothetical protein